MIDIYKKILGKRWKVMINWRHHTNIHQLIAFEEEDFKVTGLVEALLSDKASIHFLSSSGTNTCHK